MRKELVCYLISSTTRRTASLGMYSFTDRSASLGMYSFNNHFDLNITATRQFIWQKIRTNRVRTEVPLWALNYVLENYNSRSPLVRRVLFPKLTIISNVDYLSLLSEEDRGNDEQKRANRQIAQLRGNNFHVRFEIMGIAGYPLNELYRRLHEKHPGRLSE